ncbi:MAG: hypothetical protein ACYDAN_02485 [Candidatus Limnocylindrales bacterium]
MTVPEPAGRSLRMTPGEPIGEPIEALPGGWNRAVDAIVPYTIQQVRAADPAVAEIALQAAAEAYEELGLSGPLHVVFYVTASAPPVAHFDVSSGVTAHIRLDGFAPCEGETDPPSVWVHLDGRMATVASIRRLLRHELAHVAADRAGIGPGPIAEALADTFADHGLEAVRAQLGRPAPGVRALESGGLRLVAGSATVIIDGTSEMFRIAASGTAVLTQGANSSGQAVVSVTSTGLPAQSAAFNAWLTEGTAPALGDNRYLGYFYRLRVAPPRGYASSGYLGTNNLDFLPYGWSAIAYSAVSGVYPAIVLAIDNPGTSSVSAFMRYNLLNQVAI